MTTSALHAALRAAEPHRVALDDGSRVVTFGELGPLLDDEGDWLAAGGERFALLADNGVGWALTDLALHLRQLPSVPLPGYFTAPQIQHALDDAGIDCVLADEHDAGRRVARRMAERRCLRANRAHDVPSPARCSRSPAASCRHGQGDLYVG